MALSDLLWAVLAFALSGIFYGYTAAVTCPQYSWVFEQINANCDSFFLIICSCMVLVGAFSFFQFSTTRVQRVR